MRKRSIEIYLKEGLDEEDALFALWQAMHGGRRQELFRKILRLGTGLAMARGELPRLASGLPLDLLLEEDFYPVGKKSEKTYPKNTVNSPTSTVEIGSNTQTKQTKYSDVAMIGGENISKQEGLEYSNNKNLLEKAGNLDQASTTISGGAVKKKRLGQLM